MPLTAKKMLKLLQSNGFQVVSSNGSHFKLKNKETGRIVILPVHSKDLKKGTEDSIRKQAGLK